MVELYLRGAGFRVLVAGCWVPGAGCWVLVAGFWVPVSGMRIVREGRGYFVRICRPGEMKRSR